MAAKGGTQIKLWYFNMRARCEGIRYLLAQAKMPYEDFRVEGGPKGSQWQEIKPLTVYGTVPMIEVTTAGKTTRVGTSLAAARLVARMTGQYGSTPLEQAIIDAIVDVCNELMEDAAEIFFMKDQEKKKEAVDKFKETSKTRLENLTKEFNRHRGKGEFFMGGNKPTWADLYFLHCMEFTKGVVPELLSAHPELDNLFERVNCLPNIAHWKKTRPVTDN